MVFANFALEQLGFFFLPHPSHKLLPSVLAVDVIFETPLYFYDALYKAIAPQFKGTLWVDCSKKAADIRFGDTI